MNSLYHNFLGQFSRRDFLKLTGKFAFAFLTVPFQSEEGAILPTDILSGNLYGRVVTDRQIVYDQPSLQGTVLKAFSRDVVLPITRITVGDQEPSYNRLWYELNNEGFVHSGGVQPVEIQENPISLQITNTGMLAEVTVPFTDTIWNLHYQDSTAYRLYYSTVHWITGVVDDENGKKWYRINEDKWNLNFYADPTHFHIITAVELSPISPSIPPESKRLEIHLQEQVVIAYEDDVPVFMTRTATGAQFSDGDYRTHPGVYKTNRKRPSRHMAAGDMAAPNSYDLPGIPWVCYLTKSGVSFHGTYWHNDFGKPRSHGCVNLSSTAAKWIYRWTLPSVPFKEMYYEELNGTRVDIF
jgi:lipoprotein-anchoring transpeptidase ErfK/SrfK